MSDSLPLELIANIIAAALDVEPLPTKAARKVELRLVCGSWREAFSLVRWSAVSVSSALGAIHLCSKLDRNQSFAKGISSFAFYHSQSEGETDDQAQHLLHAILIGFRTFMPAVHSLAIQWPRGTLSVGTAGQIVRIKSLKRIQIQGLSRDGEMELLRSASGYQLLVLGFTKIKRQSGAYVAILSADQALGPTQINVDVRSDIISLNLFGAIAQSELFGAALRQRMPRLEHLNTNLDWRESAGVPRLAQYATLSTARDFASLPRTLASVAWRIYPREPLASAARLIFYLRIGNIKHVTIGPQSDTDVNRISPQAIVELIGRVPDDEVLKGSKLTLFEPVDEAGVPWTYEVIADLTTRMADAGSVLEIFR